MSGPIIFGDSFHGGDSVYTDKVGDRFIKALCVLTNFITFQTNFYYKLTLPFIHDKFGFKNKIKYLYFLLKWTSRITPRLDRK